MWYVEWIGVKDNLASPDKLISVPFLYYDADVRRNNSVFLELRNSETDVLAKVHGFPWNKFNSDVREYHPYGWSFGASGPDDAMFVAIDVESLKFLEFVKGVYSLDDSDKELMEFVKTLSYCFTFWDEGKTLVYCSSLVCQNAFTLLHILCYLDEGWYGDKFVLRWGNKGHVIEFTDSARARDFVSKLRANGYNPMSALFNELSKSKGLDV